VVVEQQFDLVAMSTPSALVQKLWNYCSILRDDGFSYGDYVEQLTFLLFSKWRMSRRVRRSTSRRSCPRSSLAVVSAVLGELFKGDL
jgi:hypothetical protein